MAANLFLKGLVSIEQVEAIYLAAIADISNTEGIIVSWQSEGTSVTKKFDFDAKYLANEAIKFLRATDPGKYGRKISSTTGFFVY